MLLQTSKAVRFCVGDNIGSIPPSEHENEAGHIIQQVKVICFSHFSFIQLPFSKWQHLILSWCRQLAYKQFLNVGFRFPDSSALEIESKSSSMTIQELFVFYLRNPDYPFSTFTMKLLLMLLFSGLMTGCRGNFPPLHHLSYCWYPLMASELTICRTMNFLISRILSKKVCW